LFEGEGQLFLYTGWEKFTRAHNPDVGSLVNFLWEGDIELMVNVL
jgi:hypothetical protein